MPVRSRPGRPPKSKNNSLWIFLAIIIVIAIISMFISYLWLDEKKPDVNPVPEVEQQEEVKTSSETSPISQIEGSWASNYDGAILTITGLNFTIETSGVDVSQKTTGSLSIEGNIVTFVYTSGKVCKGSEGHYLYGIEESGDIFFSLIKDICESRKERMSASWFGI